MYIHEQFTYPIMHVFGSVASRTYVTVPPSTLLTKAWRVGCSAPVSSPPGVSCVEVSVSPTYGL